MSRGRGPLEPVMMIGIPRRAVAVKDHRVARNDARGVDLPRKEKAHTYLSHEQVHAFASEAGQCSTLVRTLAYRAFDGARRRGSE